MARSNVFITKANDTRPIEGVLKDATGPVDLTGATVKFKMQDLSGNQIIDSAATIVNAVGGEVKYTFVAADITAMGTISVEKQFEAEWEVTFADTTIRTFPSDSYVQVIVLEDRG